MRNTAVRRLVCIVAAWIGSSGAALPAAAVVGERPTVCVMNAGVFMAEFATDASASDRHNDRNNEIILNDQDNLDAESSFLLTGLEDAPSAVPITHAKYRRVASSAIGPSRSIFFSEPRFLRYTRLLN